MNQPKTVEFGWAFFLSLLVLVSLLATRMAFLVWYILAFLIFVNAVGEMYIQNVVKHETRRSEQVAQYVVWYRNTRVRMAIAQLLFSACCLASGIVGRDFIQSLPIPGNQAATIFFSFFALATLSAAFFVAITSIQQVYGSIIVGKKH